MSDSPYPEHDKMRAISDQSQAIGEFLEWLPREGGFYVCEKITMTDCPGGGVWSTWTCRDGRHIDDRMDEDRGVCTVCDGTGLIERDEPLYLPAYQDVTKLLAKFFDIDLDKIEAERRAMLDALRAANA